jgi:molecular chaperone HtpG
MSTHSLSIDLEGIVRLLGQNLYSDPDVFLRELIQNAHDAIVKRRELATARNDHNVPPPQIWIDTDWETRTLTVTDNGAGLTAEEIHDNLAKIGKSGTRELKAKLQHGDGYGLAGLIGQFGIGLLSAFLVADKIEISTRAVNSVGLKWSNSGSTEYTLAETEQQTYGTSTTLFLSGKHSRYRDLEVLRSIVRKYADIIGIPIHLGKESFAANEIDAPWHKQFASDVERTESFHLYWIRRFRSNAVDTWPLDEHFTYFDNIDELTKEGRVRGVLGITGERSIVVPAQGKADLFVLRMFVTGGSGDVLPPWAKFIIGAVQCDQLEPNAARDNVVRNDALVAARQAVGTGIVRRLQQLSGTDQKTLTEIMRWHSFQVLALCSQAEYADFFENIADLVPLQVGSSLMTLPQYFEQSPKLPDGRHIVHSITDRSTLNQFTLLAEARKIRAIDASEVFVEEFLERYAKTWPDRIKLTPLDKGDTGLSNLLVIVRLASLTRSIILRFACPVLLQSFPDFSRLMFLLCFLALAAKRPIVRSSPWRKIPFCQTRLRTYCLISCEPVRSRRFYILISITP